MESEAGILAGLKHVHLPVFEETFPMEDGKIANIFRYEEGLTFEEVRAKFPNGVPIEHICWMIERALHGLGAIQSRKYVHGKLEPSNILVKRGHDLTFLDFTFATTTSGRYVGYTAFSAPEVRKGARPDGIGDMFSFFLCVVYLLGGDIEKRKLPEKLATVNGIEQKKLRGIRAFIGLFLNEDPASRPDDAWAEYNKFFDLRERTFGPKQYIKFII
jgi:serine/threonine protein kinase